VKEKIGGKKCQKKRSKITGKGGRKKEKAKKK